MEKGAWGKEGLLGTSRYTAQVKSRRWTRLVVKAGLVCRVTLD